MPSFDWARNSIIEVSALLAAVGGIVTAISATWKKVPSPWKAWLSSHTPLVVGILGAMLLASGAIGVVAILSEPESSRFSANYDGLPSEAAQSSITGGAYETSYRDGVAVLRLIDPTSNRLAYILAPGTYDDVTVSIDAQVTEGAGYGGYIALDCRINAAGRYRLLFYPDISGDQNLRAKYPGYSSLIALHIRHGNSPTPLAAQPLNLQPDEQKRMQRLVLTCKGNKLSGKIGEASLAANDETYREGRVSFGTARGPTESIVESHFDNLEVVFKK